MKDLPFKARLIRKNHSAFKAEVSVRVLDEGVYMPLRIRHDGKVFEAVRIESDGLFVYREENFFLRKK